MDRYLSPREVIELFLHGVHLLHCLFQRVPLLEVLCLQIIKPQIHASVCKG